MFDTVLSRFKKDGFPKIKWLHVLNSFMSTNVIDSSTLNTMRMYYRVTFHEHARLLDVYNCFDPAHPTITI